MAIVINGSGTVTGLAVGGLPDGTVDAGTLATDSVTAAKLEVSAITRADLPAGSVLQTLSTSKHDVFTTTSTSFTDIPDVTQAITPTASSSKILITATLNLSNSAASGHMVQVRLLRGSTVIARGSAAGDRQRVFAVGQISGANANQNNVSVNFLDEPSTTSATTYKVQIITEGQTAVVNRSGVDGDVVYAGRSISTITAQEIGA
jgi:hypothetical protein